MGEGVEVLIVIVEAGTIVAMDLSDLVLVLGNVKIEGSVFLFLALGVIGRS
jgi:hypothetical protein